MGVEDRTSFAGYEAANDLLMDVARRVQLSPTKHAQAVKHYEALCSYIDREGSPLNGLVIRCYGSGSFAIGAVTASRVSKDQHDVDVVVELDVAVTASPAAVLDALFEAINATPGSRYYGKVTRNSRCVTVEYDDGVTVDLMPIARLPAAPERAGNLFHHKRETGEAYHKPVNPFAFKEEFNKTVEADPTFTKAFRSRVLLEKAETEPMDDHVALEEKSARVVGLQLLKRFRDVRYRVPARQGQRKPPSVMMAALTLELPAARPTVVDELIAQAEYIRDRLRAEQPVGRPIVVRNPAYPDDIFTDRWPGSLAAQRVFADDLDFLVGRLNAMVQEVMSPTRIKSELEQLFGETAAEYAVKTFLEHRRADAENGRMKFSATGQLLTGAAAASSSRAAARPSTDYGEDPPDR